MSEGTERDHAGARMGMWLFLLTEILLFGALFILYAVYLKRYPAEFHAAGSRLNIFFGSFNTVILITSSFTVAWAVSALQRDRKAQSSVLLMSTVVLAVVFLVNKYFEWTEKFHHGIYPDSAKLSAGPQGESVFYGLYFIMTGLHGLHVVAGVILLSLVMVKVQAGKLQPRNMVLLENSGLYWHLVDMIWIYLFPLFYLIV